MGRKIFISYKYGDTQVLPLSLDPFKTTRVRDYVTELQAFLDREDELNKGEDDGFDLSQFKDETIASKLRDKIYDSSITIVVISKGMKETQKNEADQWIPWEVAYSLRETTRKKRTSRSNAVLAVVLPDEYGQYDYYVVDESCPFCKCRTLKTNVLFKILANNMFNVKKPKFSNCPHHSVHSPVYVGDYSYIESVKWSEFIRNIKWHLDKAKSLNDRIAEYSITKSIS